MSIPTTPSPVVTLASGDPRANATSIERRLYAALDALEIPYEPQYVVEMYMLDAWLPDLGIGLEADGDSWHFCPVCGYASGMYEEAARLKHDRDATRDERLLRLHGVTVLRIWGHSLLTDDDAYVTVRRMIVPFINEKRLYHDHDPRTDYR